MRYVAAYMLAALGGNADPKLADLKKIMSSVGIECNEEQAKKVISSLSGKNIDELVEKGKGKLASVPSAAAVAVAAPAAAAGGAAPAPAAAKESKKEEKKEEEEEDMGFGLFD